MMFNILLAIVMVILFGYLGTVLIEMFQTYREKLDENSKQK